MTKLTYLASPYSHGDAWMRELRFKAVSRVAGKLAYENGILTFCPIAHTHPVSEELLEVDANDHSFWLPWDVPFSTMCSALLICMLPGWDNSKGIAEERKLFQLAGKPVDHVNPKNWFTKTEWAMLEAKL